HPGGKKVRQRRFDVMQAFEVSEVTSTLDGEYEIGRSRVEPSLIQFRALQGIERAVELHAVHALSHEAQLLALLEARWIERAPPVCIAPARNANAQVGLAATFSHAPTLRSRTAAWHILRATLPSCHSVTWRKRECRGGG